MVRRQSLRSILGWAPRSSTGQVFTSRWPGGRRWASGRAVLPVSSRPSAAHSCLRRISFSRNVAGFLARIFILVSHIGTPYVLNIEPLCYGRRDFAVQCSFHTVSMHELCLGVPCIPAFQAVRTAWDWAKFPRFFCDLEGREMSELRLAHGLRFEDLYDPAGLARIDGLFVEPPARLGRGAGRPPDGGAGGAGEPGRQGRVGPHHRRGGPCRRLPGRAVRDQGRARRPAQAAHRPGAALFGEAPVRAAPRAEGAQRGGGRRARCRCDPRGADAAHRRQVRRARASPPTSIPG